MAAPLFGLLPAGQPLITVPTSQPNDTSFLYLIPRTNPKPFGHIAVFLLPGVTLPPNTAAAIYVALNPAAFAPGGEGSAAANFKFLGGVGPGKESAVFKLAGVGGGNNSTTADGVVMGIDIEDAGTVTKKIQEVQAQAQQSQGQTTSTSTEVVPAGAVQGLRGEQIVVLAQRIIKNAFNFLSSYSGQVESGVEVVPLKAFQEWWKKFEAKIKMDPSFLEREQD
jgi:protein Hikeshi